MQTQTKAALKIIRDVHERQLGAHVLISAADTISQKYAAERLAAGEPAFCTKASGGNQPAGTFYTAVSRLGSIHAAQRELQPFFWNNGRDVFGTEWLNTLIPLNPEAARDLSEAYERAHTFRSWDELWRLMERAVGRIEVAA